jgi:hypothetical protein
VPDGLATVGRQGRRRRPSKDEHTRHLDIHEGDEIDEAQVATWVKQAAALPGWVPGRPS